MKKKIFNILLIAIFSILILETKVNASNIVSTDKQVNSGDGNVTISITSKETLGAYNLELVDNSGLELVSSSAGPSGTANGTKISGASATGITDLGSYTFKVPTVTSDTTYKIKFRITGIANVNDEDLPNVDNNAILTVKAPKTETPTENNNTSNNAGSSNNNTSNNSASSNNNSTTKSSEARLRDLGLNPKQYDFKGFKPDTYQYNVEVPNEAEKVYIYATTKDSNAKVKSGDGNIALNEGENKVEIVVVAEDGKTKKTYTLNITRKAGEQTATPVEEPVIDEQPPTEPTTTSTKEETSSTTSSENTKITTSTTKTESTSTKSENQQIVGKVDWLKPETWGQEQYILVAVLVFLILTIIVSIILKIKIKNKMDMGTAIATKFVAWEVPTLEALKGSKVYILREKLNNGGQMNREEKDWLTEEVNSNTYFKSAVPLQGWMFDFSDILRTFIVKQYGHWAEYKATDKTALRNFLYGRIDSIVELNK